jgi:hypothetical protein
MGLAGSRGEYPYHEGKHLIAVAHYAYGDDSGSHRGAEFTLILGYIASPRQWKLFRRDWGAALKMLPVPKGDKKREFHAKEFFQRATWKSPNSPYHRWSNEKAATFLGHLLDTIHRYDLVPIGGGVNNKDFFAYSEPLRRYLTGATLLTMTRWYEDTFEITDKLLEHDSAPNRPYFVAFPGFLVQAMQACAAGGEPEVHLYLDRKRESETRALEAFNSFKDRSGEPNAAKLATLTFADSDKEEALQAADLYAHVWYRKLTESMNRELLRAFRTLTRKKGSIFVADKTYFDKLIARAVHERDGTLRKAFSARYDPALGPLPSDM